MRVNVSILARIPYWLSASLLFIALADPAGAATYEVGPARTYATLGSVPWKSLLPGDVVKVYPKAGNAPYYEKLSLSRSGTALAPLLFMGYRMPPAIGRSWMAPMPISTTTASLMWETCNCWWPTGAGDGKKGLWQRGKGAVQE